MIVKERNFLDPYKIYVAISCAYLLPLVAVKNRLNPAFLRPHQFSLRTPR